MAWLPVLVWLAIPSRAQVVVRAAPPFVPSMIAAVRLSLRSQPFYASMLANAFDFHLRQAAPMPEAKAAAYLKREILGGVAPEKFTRALGSGPLAEHRAAALLLANAATRPDQFREVLDGLEGLKPGLGTLLAARVSEASGSRWTGRLAKLGETLRPASKDSLYGKDGRLESLFDGSGEHPSY